MSVPLPRTARLPAWGAALPRWPPSSRPPPPAVPGAAHPRSRLWRCLARSTPTRGARGPHPSAPIPRRARCLRRSQWDAHRDRPRARKRPQSGARPRGTCPPGRPSPAPRRTRTQRWSWRRLGLWRRPCRPSRSPGSRATPRPRRTRLRRRRARLGTRRRTSGRTAGTPVPRARRRSSRHHLRTIPCLRVPPEAWPFRRPRRLSQANMQPRRGRPPRSPFGRSRATDRKTMPCGHSNHDECLRF